MVSAFHFSRSRSNVLAGSIGLLMVLGLGTPAVAHAHSLENLLKMSLQSLMQVEISTYKPGLAHARDTRMLLPAFAPNMATAYGYVMRSGSFGMAPASPRGKYLVLHSHAYGLNTRRYPDSTLQGVL